MTRVVVLALTCALSAPVSLAAQRGGGQGHGGGPGQAQPSPPLSPLPINRPLETSSSLPITRPLGISPSLPINRPLGMDVPTTGPFAARPRTYAPRYTRGPRPFGIPLGYGFGAPGFYADVAAGRADRSATEEETTRGTLLLDVTPRTALVFIDSAYVGAIDDLLFTGVTLTRGRHWLELEAPDYEKKLIEISITPGQPLRYRVELVPIRRAALIVIPPRPPETMYAIPGCYGGNKPPVAATLPSGCDIAKVRVLRPQQRPN